MLVGAFRGGNPLERIVGVPSLWPRPGGVLREHEMGVFRPGGLPSCTSSLQKGPFAEMWREKGRAGGRHFHLELSGVFAQSILAAG